MYMYTATVYIGLHQVNQKSSDDFNALLIWMLNERDKEFGDYSGVIINNVDFKIVKKFKKNSFLN